MWNKLFKQKKEILVVNKSEFTPQQIDSIREATGKVVIPVSDMNSVKLIELEKEEKGNGKATFFGEPTPEDEKELEREDKGFKGIFGLWDTNTYHDQK